MVMSTESFNAKPVETGAYPKRKVVLNAFDCIVPQHQVGGTWVGESQGHKFDDVDYWRETAKLLEKGKFSAIFIADSYGFNVRPFLLVPHLCAHLRSRARADAPARSRSPGHVQGRHRHGPQVWLPDPQARPAARGDRACRGLVRSPLASPLPLFPDPLVRSRRRTNLTVGVTATTTYEPAYSLARRFTTLDHLSNGRAAWNIVTSHLPSAARQFGLKEAVEHDKRVRLPALPRPASPQPTPCARLLLTSSAFCFASLAVRHGRRVHGRHVQALGELLARRRDQAGPGEGNLGGALARPPHQPLGPLLPGHPRALVRRPLLVASLSRRWR